MYGEDEDCRAFIPFHAVHGVDIEVRLVVRDDAHSLAVGDPRVGRAAQVTTNVSFDSANRSPFTSTGIVPLIWPAGDRERVGGSLVVAARGRRAVAVA